MWKGLLPFLTKMLVALAMIGIFVVFRIVTLQSDRRANRKNRARLHPPQTPAAAA